jgi:hypothetical protein
MLPKIIDSERAKLLASLDIYDLESLKEIVKKADQELLPLPGINEVHRQKSLRLGIVHDDYLTDELGSLTHLIAANRGKLETSADLPELIKLSQKTGYYGLASVFIDKYLVQNHSLEAKAKILIDAAEFHYKLAPKKMRAHITISSKRTGVYQGTTPQIIFQRLNRTAMFKYLLKALAIDFDMTYDAIKDPRRELSLSIGSGTYEILFHKKPVIGKIPAKSEFPVNDHILTYEAKKFLDLGKNYNAFVLLYEIVHNRPVNNKVLKLLARCLNGLGRTEEALAIVNVIKANRKKREKVLLAS